MTSVAGLLLMVVLWSIPIAAFIYLFRLLGVMVDGMRSINAHLARISEQLDRPNRL